MTAPQGKLNRLTGIATELVVSADLLRKGWAPFRAVDHFGPYDLIVDIDGILHRIEVKTGDKNGRPTFSSGLHKKRHDGGGGGTHVYVEPRTWPDNPKFDICAILQRDGSIEYYNRERVRIWTHDFPVADEGVEEAG